MLEWRAIFQECVKRHFTDFFFSGFSPEIIKIVSVAPEKNVATTSVDILIFSENLQGSSDQSHRKSAFKLHKFRDPSDTNLLAMPFGIGTPHSLGVEYTQTRATYKLENASLGTSSICLGEASIHKTQPMDGIFTCVLWKETDIVAFDIYIYASFCFVLLCRWYSKQTKQLSESEK